MEYTIVEALKLLENTPALTLSEEERKHAGVEVNTEIETVKAAIKELRYIIEKEGL